VALQAESLDVKARLVQAEFALLKLQNPLETQKQQLNWLMGRDPDTPFEVDPLAATDFEMPDLKRAYATASRGPRSVLPGCRRRRRGRGVAPNEGRGPIYRFRRRR